MGITFAGQPCLLPDTDGDEGGAGLKAQCLELNLPLDPWYGVANKYANPLGFRRGTAYVLLSRASINAISGFFGSSYPLEFSADPINGNATTAPIANMRVVGTPIAVTPGVRNDEATAFFVELADRRIDVETGGWACRRYNWRIFPDAPYEGTSLYAVSAATANANTAFWVTGTAYGLGAVIRPTAGNGHLYKCTTAGTSGASQPTWPTLPVATVTDGTAVWTEASRPWAWPEVLADLWNAIGIESFPGLPSTINPTSTPEQIDATAVRAGEIVEDLLLLLGCAVQYDPIKDRFYIVDLGVYKVGDAAAIGGSGAWTSWNLITNSYDGIRLWDQEPLVATNSPIPQYWRVVFPVWAAEGANLPQDSFFYVDVPTGVNSPNSVLNSFVQLQDYQACRVNQQGHALNATDLVARAFEVATRVSNAFDYDQFTPLSRIYSGYLNDSALLPGAMLDAVIYDDIGKGPRTTLLRSSRLGETYLSNYDGNGWQTNGLLVSGHPAANFIRVNNSPSLLDPLVRPSSLAAGERRHFEGANSLINDLFSGTGMSPMLQRCGPLRSWEQAVQARAVDGFGQRLWMPKKRSQHLCEVKVTAVTPALVTTGRYPALEQFFDPLARTYTNGDQVTYDAGNQSIPSISSVQWCYLVGTDTKGLKVYRNSHGAVFNEVKQLSGFGPGSGPVDAVTRVYDPVGNSWSNATSVWLVDGNPAMLVGNASGRPVYASALPNLTTQDDKSHSFARTTTIKLNNSTATNPVAGETDYTIDPASPTTNGLVNTVFQAFAGDKQFNGLVNCVYRLTLNMKCYWDASELGLSLANHVYLWRGDGLGQRHNILDFDNSGILSTLTADVSSITFQSLSYSPPLALFDAANAVITFYNSGDHQTSYGGVYTGVRDLIWSRTESDGTGSRAFFGLTRFGGGGGLSYDYNVFQFFSTTITGRPTKAFLELDGNRGVTGTGGGGDTFYGGICTALGSGPTVSLAVGTTPISGGSSYGILYKGPTGVLQQVTGTPGQIPVWGSLAAVSISGDATMSSTGALTLATSGATAGTYGDSTHVGQVIVDAKGRVTSASSVAISFPAGTTYSADGTSLALSGTTFSLKALTGDITTVAGNVATTLAVSGVTAASYGDSTHVASFTVDAKGRLTAASAVAISFPASFVNPMTTLGDIIYEDATPTPVRLAGNTTATKKYLSQTGTGTISAVPAWSQPAFSELSGSVAASQLPNPSASTLGGIQSLASAASKWINAISTSGVPSATQPAFTDISGTVATGQIPNLAASIITSGLLALARGGTNADLSATGGASNVLKQVSAGAAITVGQLAFTDLSGAAVIAQIPTGTTSSTVCIGNDPRLSAFPGGLTGVI